MSYTGNTIRALFSVSFKYDAVYLCSFKSLRFRLSSFVSFFPSTSEMLRVKEIKNQATIGRVTVDAETGSRVENPSRPPRRKDGSRSSRFFEPSLPPF